jgi:hypothetical protein
VNGCVSRLPQGVIVMTSSLGRWATAIVHGSAIAVFLAGITVARPAAAQAVAQGAADAPIGHRQPNAGNVPTEAKRRQQMIDTQDRELDKRLNICRGC